MFMYPFSVALAIVGIMGWSLFADAENLEDPTGFVVRESATCVPRKLFSKTFLTSGPGGTPFDDTNKFHHDEQILELRMIASNRVYGLSYKTQYGSFSHGRDGGNHISIDLRKAGKITTVTLCQEGIKAKVIQFMKITTSSGKELSGGSITRFSLPCRTISVPSDMEIVGMYGRRGGAIDGIGFVMRPLLCEN